MTTTHIKTATYALMMLSGLARAAIVPADVQHVNGTLVRVENGLLHVKPSSPRAANSERTIAVDPIGVKVTKSNIDFTGVKTGPIDFSQLRPGDTITVAIENGVTVQITVNTPPAVNGILTATAADSVTVRVEVPAAFRLFSDKVLAVDPQRTRVTICKVQFGPTRKAALADLRTGQPVMVLAKDRTAYVIHVLPFLPVFGTIRAINGGNVVLTLPPAPPATRPSVRTIPLDPKTEVFDSYPGEPVDPAAISALAVGMVVGVTLENGTAAAITIPHDAISGTLVDIRPDSITIELPHDPKLPPVRQTYSLDPESKFLLGRETGRTQLPNGKTRRYYIYNPGATGADLKIGQSVTFTAKAGRVLTIRITPRPTTQPAPSPG